MMLHIPQVLSRGALAEARALLREAAWVDGGVSAGSQATQAKRNEQLPLDSPALARIQALVLEAVERHPLLFSAALPKRIFPPMVNRYSGALNAYGDHVDAAIRHLRDSQGQAQRLRTDLSATLFLAEPDEYEGGELVIDTRLGEQRVKLAAGDLVLYPGNTVHRVEPVTHGARLAAFLWIESMVREDAQRDLLFDLDMNLMALRERHGDSPETVRLAGVYHNLLRLWADT
ncbi:Fe2+-dependent dioxygenase [Ideonella paludis]|uniref:Fe2+-dependent dioxygenase n=1 Tax=Ideonella paludis TaxID=1233411 RepID=A0ABS5DZT6_9BURK|nr:Fe2+-dependent dioxygenase [Ideonella paludis]MBQ0936670.1 Fe2+-dependent dioxygenase [Ideonella paludis]